MLHRWLNVMEPSSLGIGLPREATETQEIPPDLELEGVSRSTGRARLIFNLISQTNLAGWLTSGDSSASSTLTRSTPLPISLNHHCHSHSLTPSPPSSRASAQLSSHIKTVKSHSSTPHSTHSPPGLPSPTGEHSSSSPAPSTAYSYQ